MKGSEGDDAESIGFGHDAAVSLHGRGECGRVRADASRRSRTRIELSEHFGLLACCDAKQPGSGVRTDFDYERSAEESDEPRTCAECDTSVCVCCIFPQSSCLFPSTTSRPTAYPAAVHRRTHAAHNTHARVAAPASQHGLLPALSGRPVLRHLPCTQRQHFLQFAPQSRERWPGVAAAREKEAEKEQTHPVM